MRTTFATRKWPRRLLAALVAALVWAGCSDRSVVSPRQDPGDLRDLAVDAQIQELRPTIVAHERNSARLFRQPNVVATAVGLTDRGRPTIQVYTAGPLLDDVEPEVDGFPVVWIRTEPIVALQEAPRGVPQEPRPRCENPPCGGGGGGGGGGIDPTDRFDPIPIGVSTGHFAITAGTYGMRVKRGGQTYALSNNHVFAVSNAASVGNAILQPGPFDGGTVGSDTYATLADWVVIDFGEGAQNRVDAAIASPNGSRALLNSTPGDGYGTPESATIEAALGMRVIKYGRTTGETRGRVQGINATVNVNYGSPGVARFVDQIVIGGGGFSQGGDSGSLIVVQSGTDALRPVGLLYAGGGGTTIANRIQDVMNELNIDIDGN